MSLKPSWELKFQKVEEGGDSLRSLMSYLLEQEQSESA